MEIYYKKYHSDKVITSDLSLYVLNADILVNVQNDNNFKSYCI